MFDQAEKGGDQRDRGQHGRHDRALDSAMGTSETHPWAAQAQAATLTENSLPVRRTRHGPARADVARMEPIGLTERLIGVKSAVPLAVAAGSLLLGAGCGTIGSGGDVTTGPGQGSDATPGVTTELTIVVRGGPGRRDHTYSLVCDPAGGDHPDPEAACRLLREMKDPFAPVPPDAMCTEIYGGPQTATVTGSFRGEPVNAQFSRTDGCQIARWDKHAVVLVETGGVQGG